MGRFPKNYRVTTHDVGDSQVQGNPDQPGSTISTGPRPLVVGLGSHHGDDRAGWLVLDQLEACGYPRDFLLRIAHSVDLLDRATPGQPLIICDACQGSGIAGRITRWLWPSDQLATLRHCGTHDLSLGEVLELGRTLNGLPEHIEIWGIEGTNWSAASEPSSAVKHAAIELAQQLCGAERHA